jgi:DNA polymerase-3 subunit beta
MKFQLDFDILKGLNVLSAKKDIRYYMNGVFIEITPKGAYFVATDGHKMGIWHESEITAPDTRAHVIPSTLIDQVSKVINKTINLVDIDLQPMIEINYLNNVFKAPAIDGKYPDFRRVIPETINNEIAQFDPEFLAQFKKCACILNSVKQPDIAIGHNGTGNGGSIVDIQNGKFLGVIMPYRSKADFSSYKKPLWVDYAPAAAIEAPAPELQAA